MSKRRKSVRGGTDGTAQQVAAEPGIDASWPPPAEASSGAALKQPALAQLGEELLRQAEAQRNQPLPIVEFDGDEIGAILRRASELGAATNANPDELDSATLADIARQVGIPVAAVAAAVAERRVGIDTEVSLLDRLIGPDQIWAGRQSSESSVESNERVTDWLERGHGLRPRVTDDGVVIATRRTGIAGSVVRGVRSAQGKGGLGKVREVRGTVVSIDAPASAHRSGREATAPAGLEPGPISGGAVALVADLSDRRSSAMAGGGVVTAVGTVTIGTVAFLTSPVVLAALPVVAGVGVLTSRLVFGPTVRRVRTDLDYTADQIARGEDAPTLLGDIATPITDRLRRRS